MAKLANSLRKRRREWMIYRLSSRLFASASPNAVHTVRPTGDGAVLQTGVAYDEKYFEPRYGDMRRKSYDPRRLMYDVYELYAVVEAVSAYVDRAPSSLKVLDIGCNNGYVVAFLRHMGYEAYGMDLSDYALGLAPPHVRPYLYKGDFAAMPFTDNAFDLCVSWGTIEHLPEELTDRALTEAVRVATTALWIGCDNVSQEIEPYHLTNHPIDWWERKLERLGQRVDPAMREAVRRHPFLWKRQFYWDALECHLRK